MKKLKMEKKSKTSKAFEKEVKYKKPLIIL